MYILACPEFLMGNVAEYLIETIEIRAESKR